MDRDTVSCKHCGKELLARSDGDKELHELECSGTSDKYERFSTGDRAILGLLGADRLNRHRDTVYEIVSLNTGQDHTVRVKRPSGYEFTIAHIFLVKLDRKADVK